MLNFRVEEWISAIFLIVSIAIILPAIGYPQNHQIQFNRISIEQGLSQSTVFDIAQDRSGFMWFATGDGLNKFDGYEFTVYRHNPYDTTSISDLGIRRIYVDSFGYFWIITLSGNLDRYDPEHNRFIHYSNFLSGNPDAPQLKAISITETASGHLWLGTNKGQLYHFDRNKNAFLRLSMSADNKKLLSNIHLQCICGDQKETIWIGTWEGLFRYFPEQDSIKKYAGKSSSGLSGDLIFDIHEDKSGKIWIATADGGASVYDQEKDSFTTYHHDSKDNTTISSDRTSCASSDSRSNIWIGTIDAGLNLYNSGTKSFEHFYHDPSSPRSLSNGAVLSIFEDRSGGIWIGTSSGGLSRFDERRQRFQNFSHSASDPASLSHNTVLTICEDNTGALWVGTDGGGLNRLAPGQAQFKHFLQKSQLLSSNSVTAVFEDRNGTLWIGSDPGMQSASGSILTFNRKTHSFQPFKKIPLSIGGVVVFFEDHAGILWIGTTADGVFSYDPVKDMVTSFKHSAENPNSLSTNFVLDIFEDWHGNLWFGTLNGGLNKLDRVTGGFKVYQNNPADSNSISNNTVWCIQEDNFGNLWMGTWGGGLVKFNLETESFSAFTIEDGLPSNVIYSILPDPSGNLWVSTNGGLCRFNPASLEFRNYDYSDGLPGSEFNQGAACLLRDGRMAFGGTDGLTIFSPDSIRDNQHIPPIVITSFKIFDKSQPLPTNPARNIRLSYKQNFFSFEFAALDFAAPEKNQFAYFLEGVNQNWVESGSRHFASYTNIAPGEYLFRVKGTNSDGIWNERGTAVSIIITPPFWQTWWFRIVAVALLIALLAAFHRYRVNKLLEVERTRVRIARDLHDEVSATLTGIVYFTNAISQEIGSRGSEMLHKLLSLIQESTSQVQESMSDIIWSINPENDNWETLLPKLNRYTADLCESKGIKYQIEIPDSAGRKTIKMETRRHLWLIFKEIVTNAAKHSGCSELVIIMKFGKDQFHLQISDNGKGFYADAKTGGNGIKNIRSRAEALQAQIELKTECGEGTQWEISVPV